MPDRVLSSAAAAPGGHGSAPGPHGPMIEFYRRHRISPVRQDMSDFQAHCQRRESLYRHLGVLPAFFRGRAILEVGPGSGNNALYTAALHPARYVLVEPNPTAIEHLEELFSGHPELRRGIEIEQTLLADYAPAMRFDFVLCEGMLAGMTDPCRDLQRLAALVEPGGVLVITCVDPVSVFPEILRRLLAQTLIDPAEPLERQLATLVPVFAPHAASLEGMTREPADWIVDNLINPALAHSLLPIPEAIEALGEEYTVYGSAPKFLTDWRWYKLLSGSARAFNERAIGQYWESVHNLIDHSREFPPRPADGNRRLFELCHEGWRAMSAFETDRDRKRLAAIAAIVGQVAAATAAFSTELAAALDEARRLLLADRPDPGALAASRSFGRLFGRGQQYLSLTRAAGTRG